MSIVTMQGDFGTFFGGKKVCLMRQEIWYL